MNKYFVVEIFWGE